MDHGRRQAATRNCDDPDTVAGKEQSRIGRVMTSRWVCPVLAGTGSRADTLRRYSCSPSREPPSGFDDHAWSASTISTIWPPCLWPPASSCSTRDSPPPAQTLLRALLSTFIHALVAAEADAHGYGAGVGQRCGECEMLLSRRPDAVMVVGPIVRLAAVVIRVAGVPGNGGDGPASTTTHGVRVSHHQVHRRLHRAVGYRPRSGRIERRGLVQI